MNFAYAARALAVSLLPALCAVHTAIAQDGSGDFAIVNVNVIPMDEERVLEGQTVIIGDGVIRSVTSTAAITLPADSTQIDGDGRYLMPGLADLHTHIRHEDELVNYVYWGVTTIMHMGGSGAAGRRQLEYRRRIADGALIGPNIYTTNRTLDGDPPLSNNALSITTAEEAKREVRKLREEDFDFVKIYNNVSQVVFDAIVEEARIQGLAVIGHIPRSLDPLQALNSGQDAIAHTEEFFFSYFEGPRSTVDMPRDYRANLDKLPPLIDALVANEVAVMPDLSFTFTDMVMWDGLEALWNDPEYPYLRPETASMWQAGNINRRDEIENFIVRERWKYALIQELTLRFEEAGILQVIGTDASLPGLFPGKAAHRELTELVKAGLSNFDALAVGTRNAGEFVRRYIDDEARFGQVRPGFRADLVLLEGNPLDDIRNARAVSAVAVNGRYFDRAVLDERRALLRVQYAALNAANDAIDAALEAGDAPAVARELLKRHENDAEIAATIENRFNAAGYAAAFAGDLERSRQILRLNTELFPASANTWDSLAEITLMSGDRQGALALYRKALEVNPGFSHAAQQIERILARDNN